MHWVAVFGGCGGDEGAFRGFSAFFALLRVVPELSASFSEPLDDEEFCVVEGSPCQLAQDFVDIDIASLQSFQKQQQHP